MYGITETTVHVTHHPAVRETAVVVHEDSVDDRRLVAYLVPDPQSAFTISRFLELTASGQLNGHLSYELPNGLTIIHQNKLETDFLYREIFTENTYIKYGIEFHEGDCIFDVGANIGLFSLFVHQKCEKSTIYAFEPIPQIFESLRLNADLYELNASLFNCGLSDQTKDAVFAFYPHCSAYEQEQKIQQLAREEAERPFDLAQGLMLRAHLMRLSKHKHMLLILVHHISFDGWSVGVFMRELATHYSMLRDEKTTALPPLPLQYADYQATSNAGWSSWMTSGRLSDAKRLLPLIPRWLPITLPI